MLKNNNIKKMVDCFEVTVVIPVWNSGKWLPNCLSALLRQTYVDFTILLVDNGSTDGSVEKINRQEFTNLNIIAFKQNFGFAVAVNAGIQQSNTQYVVLLNVDTIPSTDWLEQLVMAANAAPADVTSFASKMLNMENSDLVDSAGDTLSWFGTAYKRGHGEKADKFQQQDEVFSACAGAALYRRSLFKEVGCFDERFGSYFEDVDLGFREKLFGYRCMYVPGAKVLHHGHSAGVVGSYYVFLLTRNRFLTLIKNIPVKCFVRHSIQLLYGQWHFFLSYKRPLASLRGYASALYLLPGVLRDRKNIQEKRRISIELLEEKLESALGELSIMKRLYNKIL